MKKIEKDLLNAKSFDEIDNIFYANDINDYRERIDVLRTLMQVKHVYSPENEPYEDTYYDDVLFFLDSEWKLMI